MSADPCNPDLPLDRAAARHFTGRFTRDLSIALAKAKDLSVGSGAARRYVHIRELELDNDITVERLILRFVLSPKRPPPPGPVFTLNGTHGDQAGSSTPSSAASPESLRMSYVFTSEVPVAQGIEEFRQFLRNYMARSTKAPG